MSLFLYLIAAMVGTVSLAETHYQYIREPQVRNSTATQTVVETTPKKQILNGEFVIGTDLIEAVAKETLAFLRSSEGQQFLQRNKNLLVYRDPSGSPLVGKIGDLQKRYSATFRMWADRNGAPDAWDEGLKGVVAEMAAFASQNVKVEGKVFYSRAAFLQTLSSVLDELAQQLSMDLAIKRTGGGFGVRITERGISRSAQGTAILRSVQQKYNGEKSQRMVELEEVMLKTLESRMGDLLRSVKVEGGLQMVALENTVARAPYAKGSYVTLKHTNLEGKESRLASVLLKELDTSIPAAAVAIKKQFR